MTAPARAATSETVDQIVAAALTLFFERGFHGTSVRDIMEVTGLRPSALYNHFPSKDALLAEVIARGQEDYEAALVEAIAPRETPAERLYALAFASTIYHTRSRRIARVANKEFRHLVEPELERVVALRRRVRTLCRSIVEDGCRSGAFRLPAAPGGNALELAAMSILMMTVAVAEWYQPGGPLTPEGLAAYHADLALAAVGATRRRRRA